MMDMPRQSSDRTSGHTNLLKHPFDYCILQYCNVSKRTQYTYSLNMHNAHTMNVGWAVGFNKTLRKAQSFSNKRQLFSSNKLL
jgi:hypothetical protein